jgi:hypothetical protein
MSQKSGIAVIGSAKMLRSIANVRFGEAAPQRRNRLRMSAKGRSRRLGRFVPPTFSPNDQHPTDDD